MLAESGGLFKPRIYEFMCIAYHGLAESELEALVRGIVSGLQSAGVAVLQKKSFGIIDFAYEIKKHKKGHYFLFLLKVANLKSFATFVEKLKMNGLVIRCCCVALKDESHFKPAIIRVGDPDVPAGGD